MNTTDINLEWKSFNVDLQAIEALAKSLDANCCGSSANSQFQLHFTEAPSDTLVAEIADHWNSLTDQSPEALSYKSQAQMTADKATATAQALATATSKLTALGLTAAEISALKGV